MSGRRGQHPMNRGRIESVRIRGFRSLADIELSGLPQAAVLIGANGSGKSNFIRFFELLNWMLGSARLVEFIERQGGADDQLFGGNRRTPRLESEIVLRTAGGRSDYRFALTYAHHDRFFFTEECFRFKRDGPQDGSQTEAQWHKLGDGQREAKIVREAQVRDVIDLSTITTWGTERPDSTMHGIKHSIVARAEASAEIVDLLGNCAIYQFHDTSDSSNFKQRWDVEDNNYLRNHGGNLAAVLYRLEQEDLRRYEVICRHIGRILPGFDRFVLDESYGKVLLRWQAKGTDKTFGAHLTSDGSLRFFALVTLLNLPPEMLPGVLLLDEPELGLHPAAITLIGGMIKALAEERQIIVATQSPLLVDAFDLDEIFVLDLQDGRTEIRKLDPDKYQQWLDDSFTPGQLWQKNLLGGRP